METKDCSTTEKPTHFKRFTIPSCCASQTIKSFHLTHTTWRYLEILLTDDPTTEWVK